MDRRAGQGSRVAAILLAVIKTLLLAYLAAVVWTTNDAFFLVGSSASASTLLTPSPAAQATATALAALALLAPARPWRQAGLALLAAAAMLLAGHRVVVDAFTAEAQDIYLGLTVQTFRLDPGAATPAWRRTVAGLRLTQDGQPGSLWVFSPGTLGLTTANPPESEP